jgi:NitT/TauT family transport system substrate-binding protein
MRLRLVALAGVLLAATVTTAFAEKLKVAVPQRGFWNSEFVEMAEHAGFFKKAGLEVEIFWTSGGSETLQTVMTGSADIAMATGTLGVVAAYFKGAPIRIIASETTGVHEVYWYVPANSPIKTIKDLEGKTVAFSRPGSSTNMILLGLMKEYDVKAKPVPTGGLPATHTQVMSGQIDAGWAVPPFGVQEMSEGKIRVVVKAGDVKGMQDQSVRVSVANLNSLKTKRDAITKYMKAIDEAIDWAYSDPKAMEFYAKVAKVPVSVAKRSVDEFFPKAAFQLGTVHGMQKTLDEALEYKRISEKKTEKDVAGLIDIVYKSKM